MESTESQVSASYNSRFGAFLLDLLLYLFFIYFLESLIMRAGIERADEWTNLVIAPVLYWVGFVALGCTPASWLCNIRIVDEHNHAPGLWRAFRRSLVPGTVWFLVANGGAVFDPRIDAYFESNPGFLSFLFCSAFVSLMCFFWSYVRKADNDDLSTLWHDAIAGTRVIEYRSERKAALEREFARFRRTMGRTDAIPPRGISADVENTSGSE